MENMKKTVIENGNENGVTYVVEINLDGTVSAVKYVAGDRSMTYDWSAMSKEEVYRTALESGHQRYTILEEMPPMITQDLDGRALRQAIKDAIAENPDSTIKVVAECNVGDENVDVSLVVYADGEMAVDIMVATTEHVNAVNIERAEKLRKRLENRYSERFSTVIL